MSDSRGSGRGEEKTAQMYSSAVGFGGNPLLGGLDLPYKNTTTWRADGTKKGEKRKKVVHKQRKHSTRSIPPQPSNVSLDSTPSYNDSLGMVNVPMTGRSSLEFAAKLNELILVRDESVRLKGEHVEEVQSGFALQLLSLLSSLAAKAIPEDEDFNSKLIINLCGLIFSKDLKPSLQPIGGESVSRIPRTFHELLVESYDRMEEVKEELEGERKERKSLQEQLKTSKAQISSLQAVIDADREDMERRERQRNDSILAEGAFKRKYERSLEEYSSLVREHQQAQKQLYHRDLDRIRLEKENAELQKQVALGALSGDTNVHTIREDKLEEQIEELKRKIELLQSKLYSSSIVQESMISKTKKGLHKVSSLENTISTLRVENQKLLDERDMYLRPMSPRPDWNHIDTELAQSGIPLANFGFMPVVDYEIVEESKKRNKQTTRERASCLVQAIGKLLVVALYSSLSLSLCFFLSFSLLLSLSTIDLPSPLSLTRTLLPTL